MVVPLVIGVQVVASGIVLAFRNTPGEIDNASPEAEGDINPSPTFSVSFVLAIAIAALVCWSYSKIDVNIAVGVIFWACVHVCDRMGACGAIVLRLRRLVMRDWESVLVTFFLIAWPFIMLAVLWIAWIMIRTLIVIWQKSLVSVPEMVLGLGVLYMMCFMKKQYEDMKTSDEEIRRLEASHESLQEWRVQVEATLTNAASAEESTSRGNAMDDAVDSAAEVVKGFSTGVAKAALHSLLG